MNEFISGAVVMAYSVAALFFLKFSRTTGDRLFVFFAIAFALLGLQRTLLVLIDVTGSLEVSSYLLRLLAFLLIIVGIVDKNRSMNSSGS